MGGGKGESPPQVTPGPDMGMVNMIQGMMQSQAEQMQGMMEVMGQQQAPAMQPLPTPFAAPEIDWTAKNEELRQRAKADYDVEAARRKGRPSTILTSPLLDVEESETIAGSVLGGV